MKTFKFSLLALTATVLITACSNEEIALQPANSSEPQGISFRMQGGTPEITTRTTATTLPYLDAFVVYGSDNVHKDALIFEGTTVALDINESDPVNGDFIFTYAPTKYYDAKASKGYFIAFSPVSAKFDHDETKVPAFVTGTGQIAATFQYTVPTPDKTGKGYTAQEDLLIARKVVDGVGTPKTMASTVVHLEFEHALSRIFVTARNNTKDPVVIKSLTLRNLAQTGKLEFEITDYDWYWTPDFTPANLQDYKYILADSGVVVAPMASTVAPIYVTTKEQGMMVLPQKTVNKGKVDELNETATDKDFALEYEYTFANLGLQKRLILLPDEYPFEVGKQYTINLVFDGTAVEFTVDVNEFATPVLANP